MMRIVLSFDFSDAGKKLREKIAEPDAKVLFYFSPYLRTKQVSSQRNVTIYFAHS
jgi:hypothetical protein